MNTKRKLPVMQIVRHIIQLAAFIIYPGLFVSAFLAIKDVYTAAIGGTFVLATQAPSLFLIAALFIITILLGRFFCGFLCSFGALGDLMWAISQHTFKPKFRISKDADAALKYLKYIVLAVIVIFGWTLSLFNFDGYASPWTAFAMASSLSSWTNPTFLLTVGTLLLLIIMVGSLFIERFFCRYLCPLGALFTVTSKLRIFRIKKDRRKCGPCALCTRKCAMGINLAATDVVKSGECIDCFKCTDVCPKGNAAADPAPLVTATLAVSAMSCMVYVGNVFDGLISSTAIESTASAGSNSEETNSTATVTQTPSSENAASAASDSTSDTADSSAAADTSSTADASSTADTSSAADSSAASSGQYADGTYTGSGTGLRGTTEVSVTVSGGKITSIEIVSYQDDSQYFNRAQSTIISEILQSQSVDVSTVSGATFSSNGILEAVANALSIDFTNPNSSMQGGGPGMH